MQIFLLKSSFTKLIAFLQQAIFFSPGVAPHIITQVLEPNVTVDPYPISRLDSTIILGQINIVTL
jgi:hypothetical protein